MGVQGLTTFVDENPHLLKDLQLRDTRVVIDGNNLFHFLYKMYRVSYAYGGDYDTYANSVSSYFKTLKSVGVEPYVVFDGCYDCDDRKFQTVRKRARDKIYVSHLMSKGVHGHLIPLLASVVFREVLTNLDIWHVTCDGDADGEIASLAIKLGCPVMSNDSDFYIYDLKNGFILFDYLNIQVQTDKDKNGTEYKYLHAQVYYLDNLLKSYNRLSRASIPLFATLMGNDFVEQKHFEVFFQKANITRGRRQVSARRHYKMAQFLAWMNNHKGDILSKVLDCVPKEKQESVKELIDFSIQTYTKVTASASLESNTLKSNESTWKSFHGNPFPDWFIIASREGKIFTHFLNALVLRKVFLPCQVEVRKWPSSMNCGNFLRQVAYSIILTLDPDSGSDLLITEYIRDAHQLVKKDMPLLTVTSSGVQIPNLKELPSVDTNRKEEFFYHCLGIDPHIFEGTPKHLKLFVALLIFYIHNVSPKVTKSFICSIIICFIKLSVVDQDPECGDLKDFTLPDLHKVKEQLKRFATPAVDNHANLFNGETVHSLSQFQSSWWATLQLSQLLMLPDKLPAVSSSVNGSFICHLYSVLKGRAELQSFIQELLGGNSTVKTYYDLIATNVFQSIPDDAFYEQSIRKSKKSRKKTKRKHELSSNSEAREDSDSEKPPKWEANCDLVNRFSQLLIDT